MIIERKHGNKDYLYNLNPHNKAMWIERDGKRDCFMRFVFNKTLQDLILAVFSTCYFDIPRIF